MAQDSSDFAKDFPLVRRMSIDLDRDARKAYASKIRHVLQSLWRQLPNLDSVRFNMWGEELSVTYYDRKVAQSAHRRSSLKPLKWFERQVTECQNSKWWNKMAASWLLPDPKMPYRHRPTELWRFSESPCHLESGYDIMYALEISID